MHPCPPQHLKLVTMLTLAIHLGVDAVILPPAKSRDSFEEAEPVWRMERPNSLWDVPSIRALLLRHNITLITTKVLNPSDDAPPDALVLPTYFCRVLDINFMAGEVRRLSRMHLAAFSVRPSAITIFAPDLILALRTNNLPIYAAVAAAVRFAPKLNSLANAVAAKLRREATHFNGLHLRVEGDWQQVHKGVVQDNLASYYDLIRQLNFTAVPVYVASGIFLEGGQIDTPRYSLVDGWFKNWVLGKGYASRIVNRRMLVHDVMTKGKFRKLHSEQAAAVDFLVLVQAKTMVGTRMSSFSFLLQEYRALTGRARPTTGTVGGAWGMFEMATGMLLTNGTL